MRIFAYRVKRDYGFAPNPFHGTCTLATCKPYIRNPAQIKDWVFGFVAKGLSVELEDRLIFAMEVTGKITYDEYWHHPDFQVKKPVLNGSLKMAYGDNIYHRNSDGDWIQENSHHSHPDGSTNLENLKRDTSSENVLLSDHFYYFGKNTIEVPETFYSDYHPALPKTQGHTSRHSDAFKEDFLDWFHSLNFEPGYHGDPIHFRNTKQSDNTLRT